MATSTTTTSIVLNWTPAGGSNSTGQEVQRSPAGAGTYTTLATLGPTINTYTDTTAVVDTVYDYQIVNICAVGGPTSSGTSDIVDISCVSLTANVQGLIVDGEYGELFNDTSWLSFDILDETGASVIQALTVPTGQGAGLYTSTDAGMSYDTNYILRATLTAPNGTIEKCDVPFSTGAQPDCEAPTNLTVSVVQA